MKVRIRKFSINKRISARSPITKMKRKYSVKKYINPIGTINNRVNSKVYKATTVSIFDSVLSVFKLWNNNRR